jgi:hypothetical protein
MPSSFARSLLFSLTLAVYGCLLTYSAFGQAEGYRSQEISDKDGVPVLLKHLPDWDNVRSQAVFIQDKNALRSAVGDRQVLNFIEFSGGVEAVSAQYPAGKLLIVEYTTPQASLAADREFQKMISEGRGGSVEYKRVGNYSVFVFDAGDTNAASDLIDQVKYEKQVQWLGEDPFLTEKLERYFALTGRDVVISTILWILLIFGVTLAAGIGAGFVYFRYRESQREQMTAFSDAGGMTRLNLDDLSEPLP